MFFISYGIHISFSSTFLPRTVDIIYGIIYMRNLSDIYWIYMVVTNIVLDKNVKIQDFSHYFSLQIQCIRNVTAFRLRESVAEKKCVGQLN